MRHFLFERWRQGQCLVEFARLIFLFRFFWIAQYLVWLSQFFVFVSAAVGNFVLFGFRLFEKKLLGSWR